MHMLQLQGLLPVQANSHTCSMGVLCLPAYRVLVGALAQSQLLLSQDTMSVPGRDSRIATAQTLPGLCIPQVWCKALDCLKVVWDLLTSGRLPQMPPIASVQLTQRNDDAERWRCLCLRTEIPVGWQTFVESLLQCTGI